MEQPAYETLLETIAANVPDNDNSLRHVLKAMREQVEPAIGRMTKQQLAEALAEAVYALYCTQAILDVTEAANEALREAIPEWKLTAGHAMTERDSARDKAEALQKKAEAMKKIRAEGRAKGARSQKEFAAAASENMLKINADLLRHPTTARWTLPERASYIREHVPKNKAGDLYSVSVIIGKIQGQN